MKNRFYHRCWMDDRSALEDDRQILTLYLLAGQARKKGLPDLDSPVKRRRLILYCLTGALFAIGLFFVLF